MPIDYINKNLAIKYILTAFLILIAGCTDIADAPEITPSKDDSAVWLKVSPTTGPVPFKALIEYGMTNPPRGETAYDVHLVGKATSLNGEFHSTGRDWNGSGWFGFNAPGTETIRFDVWHEQSHWFEEIEIIALDNNTLPILAFSTNVTETCRPCSRYPALPIDERMGASGCIGFQLGEQGKDCAWSELNESVWERPFAADSTGGDVDLEFRTSCTTDPTTSIEQYRQYNGAEKGEVPPDAGCVILWEDNSSPSQIRFIVCDANLDSFWDVSLEETVYLC